MDFAEFIAPLSTQQFASEHFDKAPVHIPAEPKGTARADLFDWRVAAELLEIVPQWKTGRLKMIMDSQPVAPEHYSVVREGADGPVHRPDRALLEAMMALGASLVADGIEDVSPRLRRCCAMLGRRFAAKAVVNLYASQHGIQAFASHCDPHEVFAVQCEGRKLWRIYSARDDNPVQSTLLQDQAAIDRIKGSLLTEVIMQPGDLLYIPRGFYHDAVAQGGQSVHLTFGVQPLYGAAALGMVRDLALGRQVMRAYLPSAENPEAIAAQLSAVADEIASLLRSPALVEDIAVRQRTMASPIADPDATPPALLVRTALSCEVVQPPEGSYLIVGQTRRSAGLLSDAARWAFGQTAFTPAQFRARFCHHPRFELDEFLADLVRLDALEEHPVQR